MSVVVYAQCGAEHYLVADTRTSSGASCYTGEEKAFPLGYRTAAGLVGDQAAITRMRVALEELDWDEDFELYEIRALLLELVEDVHDRKVDREMEGLLVYRGVPFMFDLSGSVEQLMRPMDLARDYRVAVGAGADFVLGWLDNVGGRLTLSDVYTAVRRASTRHPSIEGVTSLEVT